MIKTVDSWVYKYKPSASEECKRLLYTLGIKYCSIKSMCGSHYADIWFDSEDELLFKNETGSSKLFHFVCFYICGKLPRGYDMLRNKSFYCFHGCFYDILSLCFFDNLCNHY